MQAKREHKLSTAHGAYELAKLEVAYGLLKQQESFTKQQLGKQLWGSSTLVNLSSIGRTLMNSCKFFLPLSLKEEHVASFQNGFFLGGNT